MTSDIPVPTEKDQEPGVVGHGLWYVTRDDRMLVRLDHDIPTELFPGRPGTGVQDVQVYGVERAVMRALLIHAVEVLDRADAERHTQFADVSWPPGFRSPPANLPTRQQAAS